MIQQLDLFRIIEEASTFTSRHVAFVALLWRFGMHSSPESFRLVLTAHGLSTSQNLFGVFFVFCFSFFLSLWIVKSMIFGVVKPSSCLMLYVSALYQWACSFVYRLQAISLKLAYSIICFLRENTLRSNSAEGENLMEGKFLISCWRNPGWCHKTMEKEISIYITR